MAAPTFIYEVAVSLDGYIADSKHGVAWLNSIPDVDYGMEDFFCNVDAIVMGRKTYDVGLKLGGGSLPTFGKRTIVLTRRARKDKPPVEFWNGTLKALVKDLEWQGAKRVWLMGGGKTASAFLNAGLLDELQVMTMPVVLGGGIPMFAALRKPGRFTLVDVVGFPNGVVARSYRKSAPAPRTIAASRG